MTLDTRTNLVVGGFLYEATLKRAFDYIRNFLNTEASCYSTEYVFVCKTGYLLPVISVVIVVSFTFRLSDLRFRLHQYSRIAGEHKR